MKKKVLLIFLTILLSINLLSCASSTRTLVFEFEEDHIDMKVSLEVEGDKVIKRTNEGSVEYSALGISNKEDAKESFDYLKEELEEIKGVEFQLDFGETSVKEKLIIDFRKADPDELIEILGDSLAWNGGDLELEPLVNLLESQGFVQVE